MTVDEFSQRVQATLARGVPAREIAGAFGCTVSTVMRWASGRSGPAESLRWPHGRKMDNLTSPMKGTDRG